MNFNFSFYFFLFFSLYPIFLIKKSQAAGIVNINSQKDLSLHIKDLKNYDIIKFNSGIFYFKNPLVLRSHQTILGDGNTQLIFNFSDKPAIQIHGDVGEKLGEIATDISSKHNETQSLYQIEGFGALNKVGWIDLKNLKYTGNVIVKERGQSSLTDFNQLLKSEKLMLKVRPLFNFKRADIYASSLLTDVIIKNLSIQGGSSNISIKYGRNITIQNSILKAAAQTGLSVFSSYGVIFNGSSISDAKIISILIDGSAKIKIADNLVNDSVETGIWIRKSHLIHIQNNSIDGTGLARRGGDGITLENSTHVRIGQNQILRAGCYGIWATQKVKHLTIVGNTIMGGITSAIQLNGIPNSNGSVQSVVITNNTITNNAGHSLLLAPARSIVVEDNILVAQDGRDAAFRYAGNYPIGDTERDSIIKNNIVHRTDKRKSIKSIAQTGDISVWEPKLGSSMFLDEFVELTQNITESAQAYILDAGNDSGSFVKKKKGNLIPAIRQDKMILAEDVLLVKGERKEVASLPLRRVKDFLKNTNTLTIEFEHLSNCSFWLDIFINEERMGAINCRSGALFQKAVFERVMVTPIKETDKFRVFAVANRENEKLKKVQIERGKWPYPILIQ